jgi:hypothetical protein
MIAVSIEAIHIAQENRIGFRHMSRHPNVALFDIAWSTFSILWFATPHLKRSLLDRHFEVVKCRFHFVLILSIVNNAQSILGFLLLLLSKPSLYEQVVGTTALTRSFGGRH